jgi:hypothetical protein
MSIKYEKTRSILFAMVAIPLVASAQSGPYATFID